MKQISTNIKSLINLSSLALCFSLFISPLSAAVLGKDDRTKLPEQHIALASGIGIIGQPGKRGWSCTAFCVAPKIVATNAHCILKNPAAGRRLDLSRTMFVLPRFHNSAKGRKFKRRITYPEFVSPKKPGLSIFAGNFRNIGSANAQGKDWAFTKLNHSVCKGRVLEFIKQDIKQIKKAAKKQHVFMIGFHGDKQMKERLFSKNCRIRSPKNRTFFLRSQRRLMAKQQVLLPHTCDAYKGSSGSPIFIDTKTGPKVVGINLGSLRYERYQIKRSRYTGKVISKRKLRNGKETNMAVRPRAFLAGLARFQNEQLLGKPSDLNKVQLYLKILNHYKGRIDGKYGPATRRAIISYEKQHKLAPLGLPTEQLLKKLSQERISPSL